MQRAPYSWVIPGLVSLVFLSACSSSSATEQPLPTIVPAALTATPASTATPVPPTSTPVSTPTTAALSNPEPIQVTATVEPVTATSPTPEVAELPLLETAVPEPLLAETTRPEVEVAPALEADPTAATAVAEVAPLPTEPPQAASLPALQELTLQLVPVVSGFTKPLFVTHAGDGSGRLFVVEQPGRIWIVKEGVTDPTPFLDIVSLVGSEANEQGLLSVAFHPDYPSNGFLYVDYTDRQGDTVVARYQVSDNPDQVDSNSATVLLTIDQPYANHNGGQLVFGPDGYLYIGTGDGGSANDPHNNGQSLDTLLGKILRIDVNQGEPYGVPDSNPFVNQDGARPEIWSYGWRNPWRFSFDRATNDLYVGDVGQNQYEEVSVEPAGTSGGHNYGWRIMEGKHCSAQSDCDPASQNLVLPVAEYDHSQGCSITGGYVYRGQQYPALQGLYLYGDFCSGLIWGLRRADDGSWSQAELLQSGLRISSFGQDEAGELYVVNHQGEIFHVTAQ